MICLMCVAFILVYMYTLICMMPGWIWRFSLSTSYLIFWDSLSLNLQLIDPAKLASQMISKDPPVSTSLTIGITDSSLLLASCVNARDPNAGPPACTAALCQLSCLPAPYFYTFRKVLLCCPNWPQIPGFRGSSISASWVLGLQASATLPAQTNLWRSEWTF